MLKKGSTKVKKIKKKTEISDSQFSTLVEYNFPENVILKIIRNDNEKLINIINIIKKIDVLKKKKEYFLKYFGYYHNNRSRSGELYFIMESVECNEKYCDLSTFWDDLSEKDTNIKYSLLLKIANGINTLHELNIAHRDIKLENILVKNNFSEIKIIDFDLSLMLGNDHPEYYQVIKRKKLFHVGTEYTTDSVILNYLFRNYKSTISNKNVDEMIKKTDWYSFCVIALLILQVSEVEDEFIDDFKNYPSKYLINSILPYETLLYKLILITLEKETPFKSRPTGIQIIEALERLTGEANA